MIEDSKPIEIDRFLGLYNTGSDDHVPKDHFIDTLNCAFSGSFFQTREGSSLSTTAASVLRFHIYKKLGEVPHVLYLGSGGNLYDAQNPGSPILTIAGMSDFSLLMMYNRAYITPHDRVTGLAGEKVYVYDGTGIARPAAGSAPTGFTLGVTDSASSGTVESGTRLFAVSYETSSGFITVPGPTVFTSLTSAGEKSIDISEIPIGPSGTIARHIICTKVIDAYDGNQSVQSYFFVPDGRIANNIATTHTINFYDQDLVQSADYLFDQLSEIPASLGLVDYQGTMVTYGENLYTYIVRVSKQGYPESFNSELGFVIAEPGDSTGVKACVEYRSQLFICKSKRTGVTQLVSGQEAAYWPYNSVDRSVGTEVYGISTILDIRGNTVDYFVVADRSGLLLFDGSFRVNLTAKISNVWESINQAAFQTIQVAIDPVKSRIYVSLPVGIATSPNVLYVGDVTNGWSAESIRWMKWTFPVNPTSINIDVNNSTQQTEFKYGSSTGNIYKLSTALDDAGTAIDSYIKTALLTKFKDGNNCTYTGLVLRVKGSGSLTINLTGEDGSNTVNVSALTLSTAPGYALQRNFNYVNSKCSVKLRVSNSGEYFSLHNFILYTTKLWNERPQI
jgi:hypothetical protein